MVEKVYRKKKKFKKNFDQSKNEILKGSPNYKSKDQKSTIKNIKKFYNEGKKFLIFIMIILEWYLILNTNQFMEKGSNC